jgi:GNAT superfamily N-acetyltransferase
VNQFSSISRATPEQAQELTRIAFAAKRYWGYPEIWIESWRGALTIPPEFIRDNEVYVLREHSQTIGFHGLVVNNSQMILEHLWLLPNYIGKGFGRALFQHAVTRARTLGSATMQAEADPNAAGFYERMGGRRIGANICEVQGYQRELPVFLFTL